MTMAIGTAAGGVAQPRDRMALAGLSVHVAASVADLEAQWRDFEAEAVHSAYQRFDWVRLAAASLGDGAPLAIAVVADDRGRPLLLFPLEVRRGVARFIGGSHANFAMPLFRAEAAALMDAARMRAVLAAVAEASAVRIDLFALTLQPERWNGVDNPMALLPRQASPSAGHRLTLGPDGDAVLQAAQSSQTRKKLRKKEKALAERGALAAVQAKTAGEAIGLIDAFLVQKAERFRVLGLPNAFAAPGVRAFLVAGATTGLTEGRPVIELHALTLDGAPVAIFGGSLAGGRFSGMFNSITTDPELQRESPGEVLTAHLVRSLCARGLHTFDLGAGEARYKASLCDGEDALFDQFIPVTPKGAALAVVGRAGRAIKRMVKRSDRLWPLVLAARKRLAPLRS